MPHSCFSLSSLAYLAPVILLGITGCGEGDSTDGVDPNGDLPVPIVVPPAANPNPVGSVLINGDPDAVRDCPCGDLASRIYVLSDSETIATFDPTDNSVEELGKFACEADSTFSMGVARSGEAWVQYRDDGAIFVVDVENANECVDSGYTPGFGLAGMAYASKSASNPCDELFLATYNDDDSIVEQAGIGTLGKVDWATSQVKTVATIDVNGAELTGSGDGRLFGFAGSSETDVSVVVEFDKNTGAVKWRKELTDFSRTSAWAFAFWGGSLYFFTENEARNASKVTKLDLESNKMSVVVEALPFRVVGAGVSTCAPTAPIL